LLHLRIILRGLHQVTSQLEALLVLQRLLVKFQVVLLLHLENRLSGGLLRPDGLCQLAPFLESVVLVSFACCSVLCRGAWGGFGGNPPDAGFAVAPAGGVAGAGIGMALALGAAGAAGAAGAGCAAGVALAAGVATGGIFASASASAVALALLIRGAGSLAFTFSGAIAMVVARRAWSWHVV
jgi:hypothetical protein